ncbi:acyl-CoA dehydrogenase family protein [Actinomadura madurae]|uniref:acyl-CoA dehydrogenase family protein n=1 Tax=Actinomadura madurae TaxID=1993 RepID=UPI00399BEB05
MYDELTGEQQTIRDVAREFAEHEIAPHSTHWDRQEAMDRAVLDKLADVGFLGATIPTEHGGAELDPLNYCLLIEELGRVDSSVRGVVTVHAGLVAKTILRWGTEDQRARFLPRLAAGTAIGCFALTEPDHGSDAAQLTTRAVRQDGDWTLDGSKTFITNGTWANIALVFARTGPASGARGITCFIVDTASDGFRAVPIKGKLGLRAQDTATLFLENVRVPDTDRLGDVGSGFKIAMTALDAGRMSLAAAAVGIAQGSLDAAVRYARERSAFGKSIAGHQLVQELLADTAVELDAARLLTWRVASLMAAGRPFTVEASKAKYFASETAVRATNAAVQVLGGYGYLDEFPVARFLRDARVTTLYEGTSQVQKLLIGRALTGVPAFS